MTLIDKACTILEKTNDGSNLTPQHLKLIENAVNGFLNEKGLKAFDELYKTVADGKYRRPDYLGVKFMDRDQEGYVYFKGQSVEHYSAFYAYSYSAQADLKVLQSKCLYLEQIKQPVKRHLPRAIVRRKRKSLIRRQTAIPLFFQLLIWVRSINLFCRVILRLIG